MSLKRETKPKRNNLCAEKLQTLGHGVITKCTSFHHSADADLLHHVSLLWCVYYRAAWNADAV